MRSIPVFRRLPATVFARVNNGGNSEAILAITFHRAAVFLYGLYFLWGFAAAVDVIPTMEAVSGSLFHDAFALVVTVSAGVACLGALLFPRFAVATMIAEFSLSSLIVVYLIILGVAAVRGDTGAWASAMFGATHVVLPVARAVFVYRTLVRQSLRLRR